MNPSSKLSVCTALAVAFGLFLGAIPDSFAKKQRIKVDPIYDQRWEQVRTALYPDQNSN